MNDSDLFAPFSRDSESDGLECDEHTTSGTSMLVVTPLNIRCKLRSEHLVRQRCCGSHEHAYVSIQDRKSVGVVMKPQDCFIGITRDVGCGNEPPDKDVII